MISPRTSNRSTLANEVGLKPFNTVEEKTAKPKRKSRRKKRKSDESQSALSGLKSAMSTRSQRKNEEIREIFEGKSKKFVDAQEPKVDIVDGIFAKLRDFHDSESSETMPMEVNQYIYDIRKTFIRELEEFDYSGSNLNTSEIFLTRCELLHRLKECEEAIESAERIYTESAGTDNGSSNFVTSWAAGRPEFSEGAIKVGEGKTKENSKGDSFASAAQVIQLNSQRKSSSFLMNLSEQQNLRIKHPFSLTSATSNCHRRHLGVFSLREKIGEESFDDCLLRDEEVEDVKLEI
eukprot:GHVP01003625.1.p2 GENE.GHVP01003625.1~~GHVP01003625.1.p2  ORF type:complete len:292 (-),score=63.96 GHVP01003625.1:3231-4106(-)